MAPITATVEEPRLPPRCWSTILDEDDRLWICMLERDHEAMSQHLGAAYVAITEFPPVLTVQIAERPKTW